MSDFVPQHLQPYLSKQHPELYTPMDHAGWRYIMRVSRAFFADKAHKKYLDGLEETGIALERIPLISEMDEKLSKFGWHAAPVIGFIPPAIFLEFLSLGILPIACDMRKAEHIAYTPAPDIVHEAAGHAPIIADPSYAKYLHRYGEIARKVIFSDDDFKVYEAVRLLSDLKEDPQSTPEQINAAQGALEKAVAAVKEVSEASQLSRMGWWTTEYGLVGPMEDPKIYGAGLLSSVEESYNCFGSGVKRLPLTVDCVDQGFDITKPQPQLYVTPDFATLSVVLEQLAERMAFRRGGFESLQKAERARTTTTAVLDSGLQISGQLVETLVDSSGRPAFLRYQGPCQISKGDQELPGQGADYHREGYSTPIGRLKGLGKSIAKLSESEWKALTNQAGQVALVFESGVTLWGRLNELPKTPGIATFQNCTVQWGDRILYRPEWGPYDVVGGERVVSVFGGAADRARYLANTQTYANKPLAHKSNLTPENRSLNELYRQVREFRESGNKDVSSLAPVYAELEKSYPQDWLLRLELMECAGAASNEPAWKSACHATLLKIARENPDKQSLIDRGLAIV